MRCRRRRAPAISEASSHSIAKPEEIAPAVDAAKAAGAAALNVLASPMLNSNRRLIIERVAMHRLPAIFQWPETAEEGGFAAYGPALIKSFANCMHGKSLRSCAAVRSPTSQSSSRLNSSW